MYELSSLNSVIQKYGTCKRSVRIKNSVLYADRSRDSSVSIVPRLRTRRSGFQFSAGARVYLPLIINTELAATKPRSRWLTAVLYPGVKLSEREAYNWPPPWLRLGGAVPLLLLNTVMACTGICFLFMCRPCPSVNFWPMRDLLLDFHEILYSSLPKFSSESEFRENFFSNRRSLHKALLNF